MVVLGTGLTLGSRGTKEKGAEGEFAVPTVVAVMHMGKFWKSQNRSWDEPYLPSNCGSHTLPGRKQGMRSQHVRPLVWKGSPSLPTHSVQAVTLRLEKGAGGLCSCRHEQGGQVLDSGLPTPRPLSPQAPLLS